MHNNGVTFYYSKTIHDSAIINIAINHVDIYLKKLIIFKLKFLNIYVLFICWLLNFNL